MDLIYPGTATLTNRIDKYPSGSSFVDLSAQNELYQRNVCDRMRTENARQSEKCGYDPKPSSSSGGEMNIRQFPIVDNSFSLPQNVFERALASQTSVSITAPATAGFASPFLNDSASAHVVASGERRRTSGDYVTGASEAKRPRLILRPAPAQVLAERMQRKQRIREEFKLQILRRLDHTKGNILKMLKMQHMQGLVHYYEKDPCQNQAERNELQYPSPKGPFYESRYGTSTSAPTENDPRSVSVSPKGPVYEKQYGTSTSAPVGNDPRSVSVSPKGPFYERQYGTSISAPAGNDPRLVSVSPKGPVYERQYGTSTSTPAENDPRSVSVSSKRNIYVPSNMHGNTQRINRPLPFPASSHSLRRLSGINIVTDGVQSNEKTSYTYKSMDSVGLAWDHQAMPKIVAVHSVVKEKPVNTETRAKSDSRAPLGAVSAAHVKSCYTAGQPDYAYEKSDARQAQMRSPAISVNSSTAAVTGCEEHEDDEVVVTKVLTGRARRSISTERKQVETNSTSRREHQRARSTSGDEVNCHSGLVENPGHAESSHPRHVEHPGHVEKMELTNDPVSIVCSMTSDGRSISFSQAGQGKSQSHVHPGSFQHTGHADSDLYLGGPPPYLPVLDSSERTELERWPRPAAESSERRDSNPTSPKLTKTIPEISEKIIETRNRIKSETIEWKKKILYRLEKRLIRKLRREERATGQKTEIEDLREETPGTANKEKKSRSQSLERQASGTDSVTDDDMLELSENLEQEEKEGETGDKHKECSQEGRKDNEHEETENCDEVSVEKCEENKHIENLRAEEETTEHCENSTIVNKEEKVEVSLKELCNSFEKPLNVDEGERNAESGESTNQVDCVTNKHCQETKFSNEAEMTREGETVGIVNATVAQCGETENHNSTELSEISQEQSPQRLQCEKNKNECVTVASNANEKPQVRTNNLFESISSGFQASSILKEDKRRLHETTQESSSIPTETKTPDNPTETKKPDKKDVKVFTNLNALKKRLATCSKEVLTRKTEAASCERNIWSILRKDGIF
ncbi:hypothetical protein OS493_025344 [Desmophyllum pertusum]|uniref:Uncharacterized protein n=1 Tax=Desmophyllum pertusum TaxID=174260 RepID=A0A9X0CVY1_9CNID|nr:hypothetical protein OS493_025344 [Desmophyllum pertusum]